jgi:hypothetical protein
MMTDANASDSTNDIGQLDPAEMLLESLGGSA